MGRLAILLALLCLPASAWDKNGHSAFAIATYRQLSPDVRTKVDAVLKSHPDYNLWMQNKPAGVDAGEEAFVQAAVWPDTIKGDPRFSDKPGVELPPTLPGFPDMKVHGNWHYIDRPIITNGGMPSATEIDPVNNALVRLFEFRSKLDQPYYLAFFLHLTSDIHQPLHATSRFSGAHLDPNTGIDQGDRGGNSFLLDDEAKNMHRLWDGALGQNLTREELSAIADKLTAPGRLASKTDPKTWYDESYELARDFVYALGPDAKGDAPTKVTPLYKARTKELAMERLGMAACRAAAILNDRLSGGSGAPQ